MDIAFPIEKWFADKVHLVFIFNFCGGKETSEGIYKMHNNPTTMLTAGHVQMKETLVSVG